MATYRYVRNVKPHWDQTKSFSCEDSSGKKVLVNMGEVVELDPKAAKDLSGYFVLEKIKEESAPAVVNPKAPITRATFNESLEGGE